MIRSASELAAFERWYAAEVLGRLSYHEALARFTGLWVEGLKLNPDFPARWREDVASDLELARVLNGLPEIA